MPERSVNVELNAGDFRAFALFDVFIRLRRWRPLAVFAGILTASAAACFFMHERENAILLGVALLLIGLGLPAVYVRQFFVSVGKQAKKLEIKQGRHVYLLGMDSSGLTVRMAGSDKDETYPWDSLYAAYRRKNAVYLYVQSTKAFIIPLRIVPDPDGLWRLLSSVMPPDKIH